MAFTAETDIKAPINFVYRQVTDFAALENYILAAGAFVERTDNLEEDGAGMSWRIEGEVRGRRRVIDIELKDIVEEEQLGYEVRSKDMITQMEVEVISLDRTTTRLVSRIDPAAQSISARLILQSARLAQRTLEKRLRKRLDGFAKTVETRYLQG